MLVLVILIEKGVAIFEIAEYYNPQEKDRYPHRRDAVKRGKRFYVRNNYEC